MTNHQPNTVYLKEYRPPNFVVSDLSLKFELGEPNTRVTATMNLKRATEGQGDSKPPLVLAGDSLNLISVELNGDLLPGTAYRGNENELIVDQVPDEFELTIITELRAAENTALSGLYQSNGIFCTQCEAEGFRRITYFLDRPDVLTRYTTTIVGDKSKYPMMLSNGNLVEEGTLEDGRAFVVWEDPFKKPSYLFALVAGDLAVVEDTFVTCTGRKVLLQLYCEHGFEDRCHHALKSLINAMFWDEITYGREYDLDRYMVVAISDFNMGAMENKGLNVFNAKYVLADRATATDRDFQAIEEVIGHEYFHNWSGNRVTCRDWFQLSLKEGLTIFRDQTFSADMNSKTVKRIEEVRLLRNHQFPEDRGPMAHPVQPQSYVEINNFYTMTVYHKGGEVIRMMRTFLGAEKFRAAMDLYFEENDGKAVTIEEFVRAMEVAGKIDLTQFRRWYVQAGTPEVTVDRAYHADTKTFTLTLEQHTPPTADGSPKDPFMMPVKIGLVGPQGDMPVQLATDKTPFTGTERVLNFHKSKQVFEFVNVNESPVPSLFRDFSAPVKYNAYYTQEEMLFLLDQDNNDFNRWDISEQFLTQLLLDAIQQKQETVTLPAGLLLAFEKMLNDEQADAALVAEMLTFPSEVWLGEHMDVVDVEGIHRVRESAITQLASHLKKAFQKTIVRTSHGSGYSIQSDEIARRALKNKCLYYLVKSGDTNWIKQCHQQFTHGSNMTDVMASLSALAGVACAEREKALASFYEQWRGDDVVLDKWFTVQATSTLPNTLLTVRGLTNHPDFKITNPNRVRSVLGAFASGNPSQFHDAEGGGYELLGDFVMELNEKNPQLASRLCDPFTKWHRYDKARQDLMRAQLERIMAAPSLSKDVYELVSKSLAA